MADGDISIIIEDRGISTAIQRKLSYLLDDPEVQEGVTEIVKDAMNKFVPRATGNLARSAEVSDDEITWTAPYAHYQYVGEVYGPNKAVWKNNNIVGWRAPSGVEKYPTGRSLGTPGFLHGWEFGYTTSGTSDNWDYTMMSDANARRAMNIRITAYLKRMANNKE